MEKPDLKKIAEVINKFEPRNPSLVIPILQQIQETFGYIPPESLALISRHTRVARSRIYGILTFYAQFTTIPRGKYLVRPCRGTACHVRGSKKVISKIKGILKIEDGQTTPDYQFSLETVACLGTCFLAPAMMVNNEYYGNLTERQVEEILENYGQAQFC